MPGVPEEWNVKGGVLENDDEEWQNVVIVNRNTDSGKVNLNANWRSNDNSDYSVPPLGSSHQEKSAFTGALFILPWILPIPPAFFRHHAGEIPLGDNGYLIRTYSL
ncbi:hypothetical protein HY734_00505 [Candidatus Uhrbacteria bacterium]|nr:hypothetical protein [Candidatus Uhrbacteria bacterium]